MGQNIKGRRARGAGWPGGRALLGALCCAVFLWGAASAAGGQEAGGPGQKLGEGPERGQGGEPGQGPGGEPGQELSLEEALVLAAENNPDFAASKTALEQARRAARFSWNVLLPALSVTGGIENTHPIDPSGDASTSWSAGASASGDAFSLSAGASDSWSASIGLSLKPIAASPLQMRSTDAALRKEEETYRSAFRSLVTTVSTGFYQLLADKENITILRDALTLARNQYESNQQKHGRGLATELDLLNAEYTYRTAQTALDDAESAYQASLARFRLTLGLDAQGDRAPAGTIDTRRLALPGAEELAALYTASRSDVRQAEIAAETARLSLRASKLDKYTPGLTLKETFTLTPGPAATGDAAQAANVSKGTFSLGVTIPLTSWLPFSSSALTLRKEDEAAAAAERTLETVKKEAALDIRGQADALEQAAVKIDAAQLNYRIASRAYELSTQAHNAGLLSQTELMSARQRMVTARQAALVAEIDHIKAVYALASALGMGPEEIYALYGAGNAPEE